MTEVTEVTESTAESVIWHDVECGGYGEDLEVWAELAGAAPAAVLELGCGTGRVALDLLRRGHRVVAIDIVPAFVDALRGRAAARRLAELTPLTDDARTFSCDERFDLILMPMQVLQLLADPAERRAMLTTAATHLAPGGCVAAAIVEGVPLAGRVGAEYEPPLPDITDRNGWVYSSLPIAVTEDSGRMTIERLRQRVSPAGDLSEAVDRTSLAVVDGGQIATDAETCGLVVRDRREIPDSADHVGSTVLVMERQ